MEDHEALEWLGVDLEFLGYVKNQILNIEERSELFNKLVNFDSQKLNKLAKMGEKSTYFGYAEQELLYGWEINRLQVVAWACNEILLARAMKFHIPS